MKKVLSLFLALLLLVGTLPALAREADTSQKMSTLKSLSVMEGDPNGDLRLNAPVKRSEFTKMAVNASPYRNTVASGILVSPFADVPYSHWAAPYVYVARESGIVTGYPDASFRPDNEVKLEEALNILLKLLGYTDADFGASYPYGQYALASHLDLLDDVSASLGEALTREDCLHLLYRFLNTTPKGGANDYIGVLGYTLIEDAVLLATNATDTAVSPGYVATTAGSYKNAGFPVSELGKKGTLLIKDGTDLISFFPNPQTTLRYAVYEVLGDRIIVSENGTFRELRLDDNLPVYQKSTTGFFAALLPTLTTGDTLALYQNEQGETEYASLTTDDMEGPFTVSNTEALSALPLSSPQYFLDGAEVSLSEVEPNDIYYYSSSLGCVWLYRTRVTGVYDAASPNRDMPTAVTLSGKEYAIESAVALRKLSSGGAYRTGDTVTLLLGKDGRIADVVSPAGSSAGSTKIVGVLTDTGVEAKEKDQEVYATYFAAITLPNGNTIRYEAKKDYKEQKGTAVEISIENGKATVTALRQASGVGGIFSWDTKMLSSAPLADDLRILDVADLPKSAVGLTKTVWPQRLDGVSIPASRVLYAEKNDQGKISSLILKDVTGDTYRYGVVSDSGYTLGSGPSYGGATAYYQNGTELPIYSSTTVYRFPKGAPVAVAQGGSETDAVKGLSALSGNGSNVTDTAVTVGKVIYPLSDTVSVYKRIDSGRDYALIPLSEIKGDTPYRLTAYIDKEISSGGRVRIIIAE